MKVRVFNVTRNTVLTEAADVANSGATRRKGLLGRTGAGGGLWIVPCESVHTFFMKFPIDLIYLDRAKKVKKVCPAVRPWRMSACLTAHSILELPAGGAKDTQAGDQLSVQAFADLSARSTSQAPA